MRPEIIFPIIYLSCLLILVGPRFLDTNSSLKQFLSNLGIWAIIILAISVAYQAYYYFLP
jgi:predicted aspartyl protease